MPVSSKYRNRPSNSSSSQKHTPIRFECHACGKSYSSQGALCTHYKQVHEEARPHKCSQCGKSFKRPGTLTRHIDNVHTDERPFPCEYCERRFRQHYNLRTHMKLHMNEKLKAEVRKKRSFYCIQCGETFPYEHTPNEHLQTHHADTTDPHNKAGMESGLQAFIPPNDLHSSVLPQENGYTSDAAQYQFQSPCSSENFPAQFDQTDNGENEMVNSSFFMKTEPSGSDEENSPTNSERYQQQYDLYNSITPTPGNFSSYLSQPVDPLAADGDSSDVPALPNHENSVNGNLDSLESGKNLKTRSFECSACGKNFKGKNALRRHELLYGNSCNSSESSERLFKCSCGKDFKTKHALARHEEIHAGMRPFACDICDARFRNKAHLKRHVGVHNGKKPYSCSYCGRAFSQEPNLTIHMHNLHGIQSGEFQCMECGKMFRYEARLARHMEKQHMQQCEQTPTQKRTSDAGSSILAQQNTTEQVLWYSPSLECISPSLEYIQPQSNASAAHANFSDVPEVFPCKKRVISSSTNRDREPNDQGLYECDICGREFKTRASLVRHDRIHLDLKRHECEECGRRFRERYDLKQHLRIHMNEKPFVCLFCNKRYRQRGTLYGHLRSHANDFPFGCITCGERFQLKSALNQHMQTMHKDASTQFILYNKDGEKIKQLCIETDEQLAPGGPRNITFNKQQSSSSFRTRAKMKRARDNRNAVSDVVVENEPTELDEYSPYQEQQSMIPSSYSPQMNDGSVMMCVNYPSAQTLPPPPHLQPGAYYDHQMSYPPPQQYPAPYDNYNVSHPGMSDQQSPYPTQHQMTSQPDYHPGMSSGEPITSNSYITAAQSVLLASPNSQPGMSPSQNDLSTSHGFITEAQSVLSNFPQETADHSVMSCPPQTYTPAAGPMLTNFIPPVSSSERSLCPPHQPMNDYTAAQPVCYPLQYAHPSEQMLPLGAPQYHEMLPPNDHTATAPCYVVQFSQL